MFPIRLRQPVENYNSLLFVRLFNFFRFIVIALMLGCQSEPITYNVSGGYEYKNQTFQKQSFLY